MTLRLLTSERKDETLERRQISFDAGDNHPLELGIPSGAADHGVEGTYGHQCLGTRVAQLVGKGGFVEDWIAQHHYCSDFQRAVIGNDRLRHIGQQ